MLLASAFLASMGVCVKFASAYFSASELVFYRGIISLLMMGLYARFAGTSLHTPVPLMHFWRNVVGVFSLGAWFYALGKLPLATAMTLNYMSGIWVAAFLVGGTLVMGRVQDMVRQGPVVLTVIAGFVGVVMILRPTIEQNQLFAGVIGLLSGLGAALAYIQVAALGRLGEPEARTVLYFSVGTTLTGAVAMLFVGPSAWVWPHAWWLLPIGLLAALGQLSMTKAYSSGATLVVANLQYSGIVFAALYGLFLFGDQIPLIGWAGMALIIASGVAATALRNRARPPAQNP